MNLNCDESPLDSFILDVEHIGKSFGNIQVFDDISFRHQHGSLGISGPNGSGKSTLLQCLAGLERPTSGTVTWQIDEQNVHMGTLKDHLGYAAPYINLYNELTCRENLDFLLKLRGCRNRADAVTKALKQTGLHELGRQHFDQLSTGQQQRLRISAALIHDPDILFLDEPGSNLDEEGQRLIANIVADFKCSGKILLIASNITAELELCDKIFSVEEEKFV